MAVTVLDTCSLINLYATGWFAEALRASISRALVPARVRGEALYLRQAEENARDSFDPGHVDLDALRSDGSVELCEIDGELELTRFVQLAAVVDDGEAACMAIAQSRGYRLATDDRRAQRVADLLGVPVISTPEILQAWQAAHSGPTEAVLAEAMMCVEKFARFRPPTASPHYDWWIRAVNGKERQSA